MLKSKMDALSIPSVLRAMLENLDTKQVAVCRLVNSTWNHEACKVLENRVIISFSSTEELCNFNNTCEASLDGISLSFQNFYLSSHLFITALQDIILEKLERLQENLKRFMILAGHAVKELRLCIHPVLPLCSEEKMTYFHKKHSSMMYTEVLEMIYNHLPILTTLKLLFVASSSSKPTHILVDYEKVLKSYASGVLPSIQNLQIDVNILKDRSSPNLRQEEPFEQQMISMFIKTLMKSAINLQIVSCKSSLPHPLIERALLECFSMKSLYSLKCIKLRILTQENQLNRLCNHPFFYLKLLNLEIDTGTVTDADLKQFFFTFRHSLEKLNLAFNKSLHFPAWLPLGIKMTKLKRLNLEHFEGSIQWEMLPELKQLSIARCNVQDVISNVPKDWPVKLLEIDNALDQKDAFETIFTDANFLLNLNVLSITNVSHCIPLSVVFTHCNQLRSLSLTKCGGVTDSVLCGIRKSFLATLSLEPQIDSTIKDNSSVQFSKLVANAKSQNIISIREHPFIGNLKGLQTLVLEGEFSDLSVPYGIIYCERLKHLDLRSVLTTWRSHEIIRQAGLKDLITVSINGCTPSIK